MYYHTGIPNKSLFTKVSPLLNYLLPRKKSYTEKTFCSAEEHQTGRKKDPAFGKQ